MGNVLPIGCTIISLCRLSWLAKMHANCTSLKLHTKRVIFVDSFCQIAIYQMNSKGNLTSKLMKIKSPTKTIQRLYSHILLFFIKKLLKNNPKVFHLDSFSSRCQRNPFANVGRFDAGEGSPLQSNRPHMYQGPGRMEILSTL